MAVLECPVFAAVSLRARVNHGLASLAVGLERWGTMGFELVVGRKTLVLAGRFEGFTIRKTRYRCIQASCVANLPPSGLFLTQAAYSV